MAVPQFEEMLEAREVHTKKSKTSKNNEKKVLLVAQELKIARALAGNDKTMRDRALKSLKKWFHHRSQNLPFTEEDFLRLWKGLFYSMWMSDKPLIQEECAENIASLLHELPVEHSLLLFKCGLITLTNEWFGIDQLRLDKFMMFVRRLLRQVLFVLKKNGFKKNLITIFGDILSVTVLDPAKVDAIGLFMHVTEIFLEELAKVSDGSLRPELVNEFLIPFIKCLAIADDARKIRHIRKFIFVDLIKQSDQGLEYQEKYNAWKREGFPGTIHAMQKIENDEVSSGDDQVDSEDENHTTFKSKPLDPRAGRVDVELPQIRFNPKIIADLLLKYKFTERSTVSARNAVTLLAKHFRKLSHGTYPLGVTKLKLSKSEVKDMSIKKAVNRLVKFEKKLVGEDPRTKKRKLKESKNEPKNKKPKLVNGTEHVQYEDNSSDFQWQLDEFTENSERFEEVKKKKTKKEIVSKKNEERPKKTKKRKLDDTGLKNIFNIETPLRKNSRKSSKHEPQPESVFERNSGTWMVYYQDESDISGFLDNSSAELGNFLENEVENLCSTSMSVNETTPKKSNSTKRPSNDERLPLVSPSKKKKEDLNNVSILKSTKPSEENSSPKTGSPKKENAPTKFTTPTKELFPKNQWDEPLEEGEYEICIPSKSYVEKLKKISRKSSQNVQELINNSLGKSRHSLDFKSDFQCSTPQSVKKVKINTKLNRSQEFDEYHSQILSSPAITFDATKKPGKPLLKTPTINSPINPFYKQLYDM